jgi:hypothetical protein
MDFDFSWLSSIGGGLAGGAAGGGMAVLTFLLARARFEATLNERVRNLTAALKHLQSRVGGISLNHQTRLLSLERRTATLEGRMGGRHVPSWDTPEPTQLHVEDAPGDPELDPETPDLDGDK